jgi:hypothetical protein
MELNNETWGTQTYFFPDIGHPPERSLFLDIRATRLMMLDGERKTRGISVEVSPVPKSEGAPPS